jgi:hypothetical protein
MKPTQEYSTRTLTRLQVLANGYTPIPNVFKRTKPNLKMYEDDIIDHLEEALKPKEPSE